VASGGQPTYRIPRRKYCDHQWIYKKCKWCIAWISSWLRGSRTSLDYPAFSLQRFGAGDFVFDNKAARVKKHTKTWPWRVRSGFKEFRQAQVEANLFLEALLDRDTASQLCLKLHGRDQRMRGTRA
jgi:hypothetical protein